MKIPAERESFYRQAKEDYMKKADENHNRGKSKTNNSPHKFNRIYSKMISQQSKPRTRGDDIKQRRVDGQDQQGGTLKQLVNNLNEVKGSIRRQHTKTNSKSKKNLISARIVKTPQKSTYANNVSPGKQDNSLKKNQVSQRLPE